MLPGNSGLLGVSRGDRTLQSKDDLAAIAENRATMVTRGLWPVGSVVLPNRQWSC